MKQIITDNEKAMIKSYNASAKSLTAEMTLLQSKWMNDFDPWDTSDKVPLTDNEKVLMGLIVKCLNIANTTRKCLRTLLTEYTENGEILDETIEKCCDTLGIEGKYGDNSEVY